MAGVSVQLETDLLELEKPLVAATECPVNNQPIINAQK
jgi:hypothetical protein